MVRHDELWLGLVGRFWLGWAGSVAVRSVVEELVTVGSGGLGKLSLVSA
jgi:hypothetical protein